MKCNKCGEDQIWKGSMLDGGLSCGCVAGDTEESGGCTTRYDGISNYGGLPQMSTPQGFALDIAKYRMGLLDYAWAVNHLYAVEGVPMLLSPEAAADYFDWQALGGCSCHNGCAPCSSCMHKGHPKSLESRDDCAIY